MMVLGVNDGPSERVGGWELSPETITLSTKHADELHPQLPSSLILPVDRYLRTDIPERL